MEFQEFKDKVSTEITIDLSSYKEKRVKRRTNNFIKRHNIDSYEAGYKKIKSDSDFKREFLQHMTINTTEFFRNKDNFNYLREEILPELFAQQKKIKIWSAASSIGCEAYTIAIILNELNISSNRYKLLATDVDPGALKKAQIGKYKANTLKKTDDRIIDKYFSQEDDKYLISPQIKKLVQFDTLDLLKDNYYNNVDLILCRNVFIYFTKEIKKNLTQNLTNALSKNGILFLGNTEYLLQPDKYNLEKLHTSFYQKNN